MEQQLTSNIDILKTVFNYLKLDEQISATQVCPEFQYIIVNCMWKYKYRYIKVYKLNGDTFVLNIRHQSVEENSDFVKEYFVQLVSKEFEEFLILNEDNIIELELYDYRNDDFINDEQFCIKNEWSFTNLQKLVLQFIKINAKDLEMIFKNCKKLETLHIKQCHNSNFDLITLNDQDNCDYDALMKLLKIVKEFHLEYRETQLSYTSLNLHDLLLNKNLINLNLNMPLASLRYKETPRLLLNSCETLQIGNFCEYKILQKFARLYLNSFQNLINLTLEGALNKIHIDTQFIDSLSKSCPALKKLKFRRCLLYVDDFSLLKSIKEISLDCCMSLTWRNLNQLFNLPLLQHFHTNNSTYTRELENVFIPVQLKSLTLVGNEFRFAQIFLNPAEQLTNLKQLIYYDGTESKIVGISRKFPNLEILQILPHHLYEEDLFQLKNLKTFKTHKSHKSDGNFLNLLHLIKHSSLRELSLTGGANDFSNPLSIDLSDVNSTRLLSLTLDIDFFNYMLEFLFDLMNKNLELKLIVISDEIGNFQYYYKLVKNRKYSRTSITLCGFLIDCKDFIADQKSIERKLDLIKELSEYKNFYFII